MNGSGSDPRARDAYTVAEVAQRLGVGVKLIYRAIALGQIPARRVGRLWKIPIPAFERWLESGASLPRTPAPPRTRARPYRRRNKRGSPTMVPSTRVQDPHQKRDK